MKNAILGDVRDFPFGMSATVVGVHGDNDLEVAVFKDEKLVNTYTGIFSGTFENHDFLSSPVVDSFGLENLAKSQSLLHMTVKLPGGRCYIASENRIGKSKKYVYEVLFENGFTAKDVLLKDLIKDANPLIYMVNPEDVASINYLENGNLAGTTLSLSKDGMTYDYKVEDVRYPIAKSKSPKLFLEYCGLHFITSLADVKEGVSPESTLHGTDLMYKTFSDGYKVIKVDNRTDMISCVDSDGILFYNMTIQQLVDCTREDFYGLKALASESNIVALNGNFKKTSGNRLSKVVAYNSKRWLVKETVVQKYLEFPTNIIAPSMLFYDGSAEMNVLYGDALKDMRPMNDSAFKVFGSITEKPKKQPKKEEKTVAEDECPFDEDECPFEEDKPVVNGGIDSGSDTADAPLMPENPDVDMSMFYSEEEEKNVETPEPVKPVHEKLFLGAWYTHKNYGELRIVQSPDLDGLVTGVDKKGNPHMGLKVEDFV